ncbi:MAG: hypothetical protein RR500_09790 [Bacilli bacterium]
MKNIKKNKIVAFLLLIVLGVAVISLYFSKSIDISSDISNSSKIIIIKRNYDSLGNVEFHSKQLNNEEIKSLKESIGNSYLFFRNMSSGYYGLPYLPIIEYEINFIKDEKNDRTIQILENGEISSGTITYYCFESKQLFEKIDKFYDNLDMNSN